VAVARAQQLVVLEQVAALAQVCRLLSVVLQSLSLAVAEARETAVKFVQEVQAAERQVLMVLLAVAVAALVEHNLLPVQAEMVVVELVVQVAAVMVGQALVLHKIQQRADQGSVMVVAVLLIAETQAVVVVAVAISVVVAVAVMQLVWVVAEAVVTSVVQVLQLVRLLLEVVLHQVIVLILLEVRVEMAELQVRVETVVDLL